jgi:D-citramalate synthase
MDTTLRDGEQTSGVSFVEKLTIAQLLLEELNVDRIEIASAWRTGKRGWDRDTKF